MIFQRLEVPLVRLSPVASVRPSRCRLGCRFVRRSSGLRLHLAAIAHSWSRHPAAIRATGRLEDITPPEMMLRPWHTFMPLFFLGIVCWRRTLTTSLQKEADRAMKLISVDVGLLRGIIWRGKAVKSSIWKNPVEGRVHVSTLNLDSNQQSDLSVHGGVDKAIYVYPREHYSYWHSQLSRGKSSLGSLRREFHH
jgi:hypothetical protein